MAMASAIDSSFELSSFRVIELFFFYFFFLVSISINYIVKYCKHVFNYYEAYFIFIIHVIITLTYAIRFKESIN